MKKLKKFQSVSKKKSLFIRPFQDCSLKKYIFKNFSVKKYILLFAVAVLKNCHSKKCNLKFAFSKIHFQKCFLKKTLNSSLKKYIFKFTTSLHSWNCSLQKYLFKKCIFKTNILKKTFSKNRFSKLLYQKIHFQSFSLKKDIFKFILSIKIHFQNCSLKKNIPNIAFSKNITLFFVILIRLIIIRRKITQIIMNMPNYFFLDIFRLF